MSSQSTVKEPAFLRRCWRPRIAIAGPASTWLVLALLACPDGASRDGGLADKVKAADAAVDAHTVDSSPPIDGTVGQDSARPDGATQDSAGQDSARPDSATQDSSQQDSARPDGAAPDSTRPDVQTTCAEGAIGGDGCICGQDYHLDGFCCQQAWRPVDCASTTLPLTDCGLLDQAGATYQLQNDVSSDGNCFVVKGDDIVLDLGGHSVTWTSPDTVDWYYAVLNHPNWSGVPSDWRGGGDRFRVSNGVIAQGSVGRACKDADTNATGGSGTATAAIYLRGCDDCEVDHLDISTSCHDTGGMRIRGGQNPFVHDNIMRSDVQTLTDRHYPGVSSIWLDGVGGDARVLGNSILGGPHVGIRCGGSSANSIMVGANRIAHHELFVNGYAIAAGADNMQIFDNLIEPISGRGVHLTGDHIVFRDNVLRIKEGPVTDQYGTEFRPNTWLPAHGVKIEAGHDLQIYGNDVVAEQPSDSYGPPSPLNINSDDSQGDITIRDNVFAARTSQATATGDTGYGSYAVYAPAVQALTCGSSAGAYLLTENLFQSNDRALYIENVTCGGLQFEDNVFELLDNPTSNAQTFVLHGQSSALRFHNTRFVGFDPAEVTTRQSSTVDLLISADVGVQVRRANGSAVAGAQVRWLGDDGSEAAQGTTDASGELSLRLETLSYHTSDNPELHNNNPFTLEVTASGFVALTQQHQVDGPGTLQVELTEQ